MALTRSEIMARIKSTSKLEALARNKATRLAKCRLIHQPKGIFGRPDFANKKRKIAVFIHGCFWHQPCPLRCSSLPKTNKKFWRKKFKNNLKRHKQVKKVLSNARWRLFTIWEHAIKGRRDATT